MKKNIMNRLGKNANVEQSGNDTLFLQVIYQNYLEGIKRFPNDP